MEIRHLRIENFRHLVAPLEIGPLEGGLNVLGGDNEAGKSTVLQALRVALFDRHGLSGRTASELQPYGHRVGPEVTLTFASGGDEYRLWKRFCQGAGACLEGRGARWEGDAAEEALQSLLGFERPGRGATDARHQGVWGLLWVTQGTTFHAVDPAESARRSLGAVLEAEVGDVLGGDSGQRLLRHFVAERGRFWTSTGRPGKTLKDADARVEALSAELAAVDGELAEFDEAVTRLARERDELAALDDPDAAGERQGRLEAARAAHQRVEARRAERERLAGAVRVAEAEHQRHEAEWLERHKHIRELTELEQVLTAADTTLADAGARVSRAEAAEAEARAAHDAAGDAVAAARRAEEAAARARERVDGERQLRADRDALARAEEALEAARQARASVADIAIQRADVDELRGIEGRLVRAEARLEAGATRVDAEVSVPVSVSGAAEPVAEGQWRLTGEGVLALEGVGTVRVSPGGVDLAAAREARDEAREARRGVISRLGVDTAAGAEAALQRRERARADAEASEKLAAAYAPDGVVALRERVQATAARLQALPAAEETDVEAAAAALPARREAREAREREHEESAKRLGECRDALARCREARVAARTERDQQVRRREHLAATLAQARASRDDDALYAGLATARQALEIARDDLARADAAIAGEDPETVALQLKTAEAAVTRAREERERTARAVRDLQVRLEALGQQGLGERRVELDTALAEARRERDRRHREAGAVKMVADELEAAASAARRTFLGPVMERLGPYLRMLMPDAELVLDDTLTLTGVRRGGQEEAFGDLSLGTREQLAILVRLAFADLVAERGEPVPVILDDALAFADERRFEVMKLALARAAERHQVLVLTCRPREYASLGAPLHRLERAL
ncbi:AAA family ATPase [Arhodomonas aquaeolei]|uniref:AAA family ATPase n=1 Tax=Arhodomonas aquaeolei TaxID=2369 RepID=UPI000370FEAA|nr:AAA family ATPase [Arhodomonas aquaeolei]